MAAARVTRAVASGLGRGAGRGANVRVVTYNVLTPSLCTPRSFAFRLRDPADLAAETRYQRLVERLDAEVDKGAVVCLQEVSEDWGGRLLGFFARRGYMFVHGNYGNKFSSDAMGVGVAFPLRSFALVAAELPRVSNTKPWPRPPKPSLLQSALDFALAAPVGAWQGAKQRLKRTAPRIVTNAASAVQSAVTRVLSCGRAGPSVPWGGDTRADIWQAAKGRSNRAVMVRLRHVDAGAEFVVGTYHMPCAFRTPAMMVIHAALIAQKVTSFAQGLPAVLAGDFNFKPHAGEACYQLVTTGRLEPTHPHYPQPPAWEPWRPELSTPFTSAYAAASEDGKTEPAFTNFVSMPDDEFCDTLDYVFVSPGVSVTGVDALPSKGDCGPMPNKQQPSDHLCIAADLVVPVVEAPAVSPSSGGDTAHSSRL